MFIGKINIKPKADLLDPAGKAVLASLSNHLQLDAINDVRVGKLVELKVDANSIEEAEELVRKAAEQLIVNKVMEDYTFSVEAI
ncbi:MAG TPA: phosphoribosylformylglycinamidine synthase subunit PurS [Chitinophagaceae bacterium]|nr:phosphoribosylformylglycinamidine synthase subunit PurS [Chitinophagaceae bacterium]